MAKFLQSLEFALAAVALLGVTSAAEAAESATSFYLLGSKGAMAGFIPPPGTYLMDTNYYYSGSADGRAALGVTLRKTGVKDTGGVALNLEADVSVDAKAYFQMPSAIWVLPTPVLGGNLGFGLTTPIGWKDVNADIAARATLTLGPPLSVTIPAGRDFAFDDQNGAFGDPVLASFIGWHQGNLHWNVGTLINVPLGQWDTGQLANLGFNHWAFDINGAVTWADPKSGLDLSAATGITFNTENPDTHYKSGTDFHIELAAMQSLSKQLAIGVTGYYYKQITGDSGAGALLGDFKGQIAAIGPAVTYNFQIGQLPVATSLKWNHEFAAENRLSGDMAMVGFMIPLGPPPTQPAPLK